MLSKPRNQAEKRWFLACVLVARLRQRRIKVSPNACGGG